MLRYLRFLFHIYTCRLGRDLSLPYLQLSMTLLGSLCFFFFHLISFNFIVGKFTFPGWSIGELYTLFFTFEIFTYLAFYIFWKGFIETVRSVNTGQFDMILAKPASSWLVTFFRGGGLHNFLAAALGLVYLLVYLYKYSLPISVFSFSLYTLSLGLSLAFILCFTSIFISLNFIYGNFQAAGIGFTFQDLFKYPSQIYPRSWIFIFLVIPIASLVTVPTCLLLHKSLDIFTLSVYVCSIVVSILGSHFSWRFGLRHYSSASS